MQLSHTEKRAEGTSKVNGKGSLDPRPFTTCFDTNANYDDANGWHCTQTNTKKLHGCVSVHFSSVLVAPHEVVQVDKRSPRSEMFGLGQRLTCSAFIADEVKLAHIVHPWHAMRECGNS